MQEKGMHRSLIMDVFISDDPGFKKLRAFEADLTAYRMAMCGLGHLWTRCLAFASRMDGQRLVTDYKAARTEFAKFGRLIKEA